MGRGAAFYSMEIVESDSGGLCVPAVCPDPESPALGAIEEPEVCFYQTVGLGGFFSVALK